MAAYGYGNVPDRGFVAFERELDEAAWKDVATKKYDASAKENAAALLTAPQPVVWKLRLRWGIAGVIAALGASSLGDLDDAWDAAQRRLFHRIAAGVDDEDRAVRVAADRLRAQVLSGTGTAQTQLDYDAEVDFGRQQIALATEDGPLAGDAKKLKLGDALADVTKTTEALAKGLGRGSAGKRRPPSRQLRDAIAECAAAFNAVHEDLAWFAGRTPPGPERDHLAALLVVPGANAIRELTIQPVGILGFPLACVYAEDHLAPFEALLSRHQPPAPTPSAPSAPASPPAPEEQPA